jgi:nitrogen regulatory protein PII
VLPNVAQKKVEIVLNQPYLERTLALLEAQGVKGYTVIRDVTGLGRKGRMRGDELTGTFENAYIFTVCDEDTANRIAAAIGSSLRKYGGLCIVSDVLSVRG